MESIELAQITQLLGELKGLVTGITQRQDVANGRTDKNEKRIDSIELAYGQRFDDMWHKIETKLNAVDIAHSQRFDGLSHKIESLEAEKNVIKGNLQSIRIFGIIFVFLAGVVEFLLLHYWK